MPDSSTMWAFTISCVLYMILPATTKGHVNVTLNPIVRIRFHDFDVSFDLFSDRGRGAKRNVESEPDSKNAQVG